MAASPRDAHLFGSGDNHFNRACPEQKAGRLVRQIAKLGFECTITPSARGLVSV